MITLTPEAWAWTARPLIVFADSSDTPALATQREALQTCSAELTERQMLVVEIVGNNITLNGEPRHGDPAELKQRYEIPPDADFAVRLVGKDTGIKLRRSGPVTLNEIFGLVDAMPMRRLEMRDATR